MRAYLRDRFPALEHAPLTEARACRYELTPDSNFIAARHPEHPGVWLLGGGSGHGFKHGPAMAELMAAALAGAPLPARYRARCEDVRAEPAHGGRRCETLSL